MRSVLAIFSLAAAVPAMAAEPRLQTSAEALAQDAASYAAAFGTRHDEALRRLEWQQQSLAVTEPLRLALRDRLAGMWIEHRPGWKLVILLTGTTSPILHLPADLPFPVEIRAGAAATRAQVLTAIDRHRRTISRAVRGARGMGHDPRTGKLVVFRRPDATMRPAGEVEAELAALTGVPVEVRTLAVQMVNLAAAGGSRLVGPDAAGRRIVCTTGFVVQRGELTGVTTAAHCPDGMAHRDLSGTERPLRFEGQWGAAEHDIQIHTGDDALAPVFYADRARTQTRPLTSWITRPQTRSGDFVCMRGESSGYNCSEVELPDFAPPGELCGGLCAASWVTVRGPQCRHGDSGAPIFIGTRAMGTLKGGAFLPGGCAFFYYMSVDYLPGGWRLARGGAL